jgi:predicted RNA-binding protein with PIN domain
MRIVKQMIIDGMNVIGSRPDGWWHDREGAALRLLARLQSLAAREPPELTLVLDGASSPRLPEGAHRGVRVLFATDAGFETADDRIVALLNEEPHDQVEVVTSDRALRARVRQLGGAVVGPRVLLERLDAIE